jgi:hypothetical protein
MVQLLDGTKTAKNSTEKDKKKNGFRRIQVGGRMEDCRS